MRRGMIGLVTALLVLGLAAPAVAGSKIRVRPNPVEQGDRLKIKAKDCVSGPDWEAFVEVEIVEKGSPDDPPIFRANVPADDDGVTVIKTRIAKKKYGKGKYIVRVWCIHEFDDGDEGVWYNLEKTVRVVA